MLESQKTLPYKMRSYSQASSVSCKTKGINHAWSDINPERLAKSILLSLSQESCLYALASVYCQNILDQEKSDVFLISNHRALLDGEQNIHFVFLLYC